MNKFTVKVAALTCVLCIFALGIFVLSQRFIPPLHTALPESGSAEETLPEKESAVQSEMPYTPKPPVSEPKQTRIKLTAAGDNLIHENLYMQAAARGRTQDYDFEFVYRKTASLFKNSDICFINQETIIAPQTAPLSGYPLFNSPKEVGDEIARLGFNVVNISNNHIFDMGEKGLSAAMDYWNEKPGLLLVGAWYNDEDMHKPKVKEINGIKVAFVAATEHTNGLNLPANTDIRYMRTDERELMHRQVTAARAAADFVVASLHWGTEDSLDTNRQQVELAQQLADWGVDLIIGHHSHTLQNIEWRSAGSGRRTLVVYSLGNFISSMLNPQNMLGGVLDVEIVKDPKTGHTTIEDAKIIPIVTHYDGAGRKNVHNMLLSDYSDEMASKHGVKANYAYFGMGYLHSIVERNIPEIFRKP